RGLEGCGVQRRVRWHVQLDAACARSPGRLAFASILPKMIGFAKAHAYGNDFIYVRAAEVDGIEVGGLAREICHRQTGIGADGLIVYESVAGGAAMRLFNADGSSAEISGNGVRGLAALLALDEERLILDLTVATAGGGTRLTRH